MIKTITNSAASIMIIGAAMMSIGAPNTLSAKEKNVGIQVYSVIDAFRDDPKETATRLSQIGYHTLELVQWGGQPTVFGVPAAEFKAHCDSLGTQILSTHSGIQEEPGNEAENIAKWRQLFEIQKTLGGKYFIVPAYQVDYTTADVKRMCDYFNKIGKIAKEYGLKFGYHNHAGEFEKLKDSDKIMWEYLVENTDPEYVCFQLDVWLVDKGGKDPVEYLKKYPSRIAILHVKDKFLLGESGRIDFKSIFNQFYKNGMCDYVVEMETPQALREKKNPDGSTYSPEQVKEEMYKATKKNAEFLQKAKYVK